VIENKWVNGGIAVAVAGALTGLAVWMSSKPPVEQSPRSGQPGPVNDQVEKETQAAPPDMGGLKPPTKG
jgi:hypothetical protein